MASFVESASACLFFVACYSKVVSLHIASEGCGILMVNEAGCTAISGCFGVYFKLVDFFFDNTIERGVDVMFRKEAMWTTFEGDLKLVDNSLR